MAPAASNVIDFDTRRVEPFVMKAIEGFLKDPPDTDYQRGYLAGLINVYREGLGRGVSDSRLEAADRLLGGA